MKNEDLPDMEAACTPTVFPLAEISLINPPHFSPPLTPFSQNKKRQVNPLLSDIYEIQPEPVITTDKLET
jgi:hypothetical protein